MTAVDQFIPSLAERDAIGAHTLQVQQLLRSRGFESEIFAGDIDTSLAERARPYRDYERHRHPADAWILFQFSIGSPVTDYVIERRAPTILNYHNITPARFLEGWEPRIVDELTVGRLQLTRLAGGVRKAIAVSQFNERELKDVGYGATTVAPLLIDLSEMERKPDKRTLARLGATKRAGGSDLLFVGRIVPNKAQHDLIKVLAAYRQLYDPLARLHLVGGAISEAYERALHQFAAELDLEDAVDFAGSVSSEQLAAHYGAADVFVCCSDHEGFCVPLVEAMHHRVPIVAYGAAAVPETAGDAGVVLADKTPARVAAAVWRVISDAGFRESVVEAGGRRLGDYSLESARPKFASEVEAVVGAASG